MANGDDPLDVIKATQASVIHAMRDVINALKEPGVSGLTWDQIEYLLNKFEEKQPTVFIQKGDQ